MASCYSYESTIDVLHTPLDLCWWVNSLLLQLGSELLDSWQRPKLKIPGISRLVNHDTAQSRVYWKKKKKRKRQIPAMTFVENKIILHFINIQYPLLSYSQSLQCARSLELFLLNDALIHSLMLALSIIVCSVICTASTALLTCQF